MLQCLLLILILSVLCVRDCSGFYRGGGRLCVLRDVSSSSRHHTLVITPLCLASDGAESEKDVASEQVASKFITAPDSSAPQGYLSSDMNKMEDGKQNRVLAYIGLALIPCLFLVPFFLSRDFVPPTIE